MIFFCFCALVTVVLAQTTTSLSTSITSSSLGSTSHASGACLGKTCADCLRTQCAWCDSARSAAEKIGKFVSNGTCLETCAVPNDEFKSCLLCSGVELTAATTSDRKCTDVYAACVTTTDKAKKCACYQTYRSCTKSIKACIERPTAPTTPQQESAALAACVTATGCTEAQCLNPGDPAFERCVLAEMQQRSMCAYEGSGSMDDDTRRLMAAAKIGVISAVTKRICSSLRAYLVCSRRVLEAGMCDTSKVDIAYADFGVRDTFLCRDNETAALLKDIECDMCSALPGFPPLVPGATSMAPNGPASKEASSSHRLATSFMFALATILYI